MDMEMVTSVESSQSMGTKEICILAMDYDPKCLSLVTEMLRFYSHKVLHFGRTTDALNAIWKRRDRLDFVLTNVHRSDINGSEILHHIEKEFKLRVILMAPDEKRNIVPRSLESGITLYFVKSFSMTDINNLRRYEYAKEERGKMVASEAMVSSQLGSATETVNAQSVDEVSWGYQKHNRKEPKEMTSDENEVAGDDSPGKKKPRVVWSTEMHQKFLKAIEHLGHDRAFPKKIVEVMDVPGLTRENVASHLQKYRMSMKRAKEELESATHSLLNFNSSQITSTFTMQPPNLSHLPQRFNAATPMPPPNQSCFINHNVSSFPNLDHSQSLTMCNHTNLHSPYALNVPSVYPLPQSSACSTQVEPMYDVLGDLNFGLYDDQAVNTTFGMETSMSSRSKDQVTSSNEGGAYVGYRLTRNGQSVEFGQVGGLSNDEIGREDASEECHFVSGSSNDHPLDSVDVTLHENPSLPPLLEFQYKDSFGDELEFDGLINPVIDSKSPQMFWGGDFDDTLFSHDD